MSYFAAVLVRTSAGWMARELDLDEVETIDDIAELVRDASETAATAMMFLEQDDEYVGILRMDSEQDDLRVFVSDGSAAEEYELAGLLVDGLLDAEQDIDDEPVGDADLVADLGTSAHDLLALVSHEGTLPVDVITAVCEKAGCLDALEGLRGG